MMKAISNRVVKVVLLSLIIICTSTWSMATIYYVSSTGNDTNSGLTTALPWKTITKVNSATFKAGDQILFKRGDTFRGAITTKQSGTSGNPIKYGAYGTGANPNITGFTTVSAWTNLGSNIWESTSSISTLSDCNLVSINGENTPMGRTPNLDSYYTVTSHSSNTSITSSNLTGTPNWTGAQIVNRLEHWTWRVGSISSQSGSTITYTDGLSVQAQNGWGFFIQNDSRTLDVQNEWYYNPTTKKIRVYSSSQPTNVKVASVSKGIYCELENYLTIENLTISGFNEYGIHLNKSNHIIISGCRFEKIGFEGVYVYGSTYYTIDGNSIKNCNYTAIGASGSGGNNYGVITNNVIDSTNLILGVNRKYAPGAIMDNADRSLIQYNSIDHSGYVGIYTQSQHGEIRNNFINNSAMNRSDGGGIYTNVPNTGLVIDGNVILNSQGYAPANGLSYLGARGIYCDINTSNVTITNNTCAYNWEGIYLSSGSDHVVLSGNTCYNNTWSQIHLNDAEQVIADGPTTLNTLTNNIFVSRTATYKVAHFSAKSNIISSFFSSANGNYYSRPLDENDCIYVTQPSLTTTAMKYMTLSEWKTFSGVDANSKKSPQTITSENEMRFEYNATKAVKKVTLSQSMIDVKGTIYATSVSLQPYTSIVLIKDANQAKYTTEYKSICEGLSYKGWTTTGKYERTLVAKSGIDSIVTTYLTVNPKYAVQENVTILSGETYKGWSTSGTYTRTMASVSGCDSVITTHLTVDINTVKVVTTQNIQLKKGNNMVSTYLLATNPDVSTVTKTIRDSGHLIKMQNESGSSYENWGTLGGWTNNLGSLQKTEGYRITVANDCVLHVTGTQIDLPLNISLNTGWNIISFPRADILDAKIIIQSLIDQNALIKVQDEMGNSIEDWGVFGGWKNGIGNFLPGKAYRVKVSKSTVLSILDSYPKSVAIPVYAEQTQYFKSVVEGNGSDHMNINLVGLKESGLSAGDELAAFDGKHCVGTLKITDQHLREGAACLIASCSTGDKNNDGFNEGSSIQLQLWNQLSGEESRVQVSILNGSPTYLKNATMLGKLKSLTTSVVNLEEMTQIEVYPNPTQGRFTVRFSDLPISGSRIDVLDLSGRKIASRVVTGITEEFDITGKSAGMYLVKSILGGKEKIDKLVIQ